MLKALGNFALGSLGALLCCELLLQCLPVQTATQSGYYLDPLILSYPKNLVITSSTGWDLRNPQVNQANNFGFVAARDFHVGEDAVALIGDSYVESSMLRKNERPDAQLEKALGGRPVYAMGAPGSALLDYAERIRWASERLRIRDFVLFLEEGDLRGSVCNAGQIPGPCLDEKTLQAGAMKLEPPGLAKRILRHSALVQYLTRQINLDLRTLPGQVLAQARPPEAAARTLAQADQPIGASPAGRAVAQAFFERVAAIKAHRVLFVLDARRPSIYAGRGPTTTADLELFARMAIDAGFDVVRADRTLSPNYATQHLRFDVGPYDAHINALGWRLLSGAVAEAWHGSSQDAQAQRANSK